MTAHSTGSEGSTGTPAARAAGYRNFIAVAGRAAVFAYVPKVACTNWKSLLRRLAGAPDWAVPALAHDRRRSGLDYLDPDGVPADAARLADPGTARFAMVRDPFSRTLSAYLNKVASRLPVRPETPGEDHFRRVVRAIDVYRRDGLGAAAFPEITFEVFLRWLGESGSPFVRDEHWAPQCVLLRQPEVRFDILGRFEALPVDGDRILAALGTGLRFPPPGPLPPPTGASARIGALLTPVCADLIRSLYAEDFDRFGYPRRPDAAAGAESAWHLPGG